MEMQGNRMVTPEAVPISIDYAGLGSRGIAQLLDSLIIFGIGIGLTFVVAAFQPGENTAIALVILFVFFWQSGYYILFEGLWNGQTPGKRQQHIRVLKVDGEPVGWAQAVIRNLVRPVDTQLISYGIGIVFIVTTQRSQRLGDLAAGTVVLHEGMAVLPRPVYLGPAPAPEILRSLDTSGIGEHEYSVVRAYLERRWSLPVEARMALAAQVASVIRPRVAGSETWPSGDEAFLEAVAHSYRGRFGVEPAPAAAALPGGYPPPPPGPQTPPQPPAPPESW